MSNLPTFKIETGAFQRILGRERFIYELEAAINVAKSEFEYEVLARDLPNWSNFYAEVITRELTSLVQKHPELIPQPRAIDELLEALDAVSDDLDQYREPVIFETVASCANDEETQICQLYPML